MPKRGMGNDFEEQAGNFRDGEASDSSAGNPFSGSNFGGPGISGRKILNPKRLRGARPVTPKPLPPQPQAQSQPVTANTGGFGFTFGGNSTPAASSSSGFNFTSQQPAPSFNFGPQQASAQPAGFSGASATGNNPFQSSISSPVTAAPNTGFQGSIFNIQPSTPSNQGAFTSSFGGFGNQTNSQPANNIFNNPQPTETKPLFSFGAQNSQPEQPKQNFAFGQSANPSSGFGTSSQSNSAPSSFTFNNDNTMTDENRPAPPSASFSFGASHQQASSAATATAATTTAPPASLFSFTSNSTGIQNPFASSDKTQTQETTKTLPFEFGFGSAGPISLSAPATSSLTATTSTTSSGESLFKFSQPSTTSNIFASASSKPSTTTASNMFSFSSNQSSSNPSTGLFSSASLEKPTVTGSIFGNPTSAVNTPQPTFGASTEAPLATTTPLFTFKPTSSQDKQDTSTDKPTTLFGSSIAAKSPDKGSTEAQKTPLFGAPVTTSATETSKVEQKPLPSFSFGSNKTTSPTSPTKLGTTTQTGISKDGGLFQTNTSSSFAAQSQMTSGSLFTLPENKDSSKPLFAVNSAGFSNPSGAPKPLFAPTTDSTPNAGSLFSPSKASSTEKATLGASTESNLFKPQPSTNVLGSEIITSSPFILKPTETKEPSSAPTSKPFGFAQQPAASDKSPVKSAPTVQKDQANGVSKPFAAAQSTPEVPTREETASPTPVELTSPESPDITMEDLDIPPNDPNIPESLIAKWTTLRKGDLPTDEVVDILLHDWVLQIDIPSEAFAGMDMDGVDEITYLWHQNSVDAAWESHIKALGNKDRNLLEVYRIVLALKTAVDRFHKRVWDKEDSLADPKIFDERYIRKMAKENIEAWENGLKSEIKNLKKRKVDTMRSDSSGEKDISNNAKRSKVGELGKVVPAKEQPVSTPVQSVQQNQQKQHFSKDEASKDPKPTAFNIFGAAKPSLNQEGSSKVNLLAPTKSTTQEVSSPQRSKTSQLFASIANKPVESPSTAPPAETSKKSLFDRISRDSNGDPLREVSDTPPKTIQETESHSEQDGSGEAEDEDYDEDESEDDDEEEDGEGENEEEGNKQSKSVNIFAQSSSAAAEAKEAALGASLDNTWKPDSPIRFSKSTSDPAATASPSKPVTGFVPVGGMPKMNSSASPFTVSSQDTWKAPDNPFGNFKNIKPKSDTEKKSDNQTAAAPKFEMPKPPAGTSSASGFTTSTMDNWQAPSNPFGFFKDANTKSDSEKKADNTAVSAPKFEMPKPPANSSSSPDFTTSSMDNWKAPANPFGFFKKVDDKPAGEKSVAPTAPTVTLTAPSPQRPTQPLFTAPNLFASSTIPQTADTEALTNRLFGPPIPDIPIESILHRSNIVTSAPSKPLFDIPKSETSGTTTAPISNHWLDFAKGINKPSSPAPSGASVFASLNTSLNPSRASSPAMSAVSTAAGDTDAEHHDDDETPKEAQLDLGSTNAGEEDEEFLQSVRAKAYEFYGLAGEKKEWTVRGVGELRVLKHKETGKVRAVLRADQSAKVLLNAGLLSAADYTLMSPKRVNFTVATTDGIPSRWFIQVGKEDDAKKLSEILETNKSN